VRIDVLRRAAHVPGRATPVPGNAVKTRVLGEFGPLTRSPRRVVVHAPAREHGVRGAMPYGRHRRSRIAPDGARPHSPAGARVVHVAMHARSPTDDASSTRRGMSRTVRSRVGRHG